MAFTSTLISTANLGTWDYYIMSDNVAIWRVLNGLAAWFAANNGMIQSAAFMGALICLALFLFNAAAHSKSIGAGTLGVWFFFMSGMGMTGQAQVTNIYTNQVTIINNVPALALVPASMFSTAAYKMFKTMETAFSGVTPSYMSVDQNAFVGPIDILMSLRSPTFPNYVPYLNKTLVQVVHDCYQNPTGGASPTSIDNAPDALAWLVTYGRPTGLTKIYSEFDTTGQGTMSDCASALTYIDTEYTNLANGGSSGSASMASFLNAETTKKNPQAANGSWTGGAISSSWNALFGSVAGLTQTAQQFSKNALTATTIQNTMDCLSQSGMLTTPEACQAGAIAMADGKERWKTEAAMAGSSFLKTMFTSMGFLQILFFALFPFIAIYGLVVVNKTATVFGGYVLLGIWSQSWMIVVAPIQSYIQTSIVDDMTKALSLSHAVTVANMGTIYDQLSTKLAVASDMMANAQMLSLALLSGSVYAMSSLASKWNGGGHNDSSLLQNKPVDSAPLYKNNSSLGTVGSIRNDHGGTTSTLDEAGASGMSIATTFMANQGQGSSHDRSRMTSEQRANALVAGIKKETGYTLSKEDAASIIKSSDAQTQFTGAISAGVAGDIVKGMMAGGALKGLAGNQLAAATRTVQKAEGEAIKQLAAKDAGFISKLSSADAEVRGEAWGQVAEAAVTALTVGAMAVELATGIGALAEPATLAAGVALRAGIGAAVKKGVSSRTKHAGAAAAKKESSVMGALKDLPGAVAAGVSGNVDAMAKAVMSDGIKKSNSYSASKKNSTGTGVSVNETDGLTKAVTGATTDRYTQSASVGETSTTSITLDHASLTKMAAAGFNGKTSDQIRQQAATTAAMYRTDQIRKKDGSAFTAQEKARADQFVATAMMGHSSGDAGVDQFKRNVLFEQALTNQVNGSLGTGPGIPVGANFTNEGQPVAVAGTNAVAPTKGHWQKDKAGKHHDPKQDAFTLRQWGDGEDPNNKAGKAAAAKAGMHWVPGTAGHAATDGTMRLQPASEAQAGVNTHVNGGGIGATMANGQGSQAFQRTAQIVDTADRALEGLGRKAITAEQALGQFSPEALKEFGVTRDDTGHYIMAAGAAKVTADMAGAIIEKIRGGGQDAAHAPTTSSTEPAKPDNAKTQRDERAAKRADKAPAPRRLGKR